MTGASDAGECRRDQARADAGRTVEFPTARGYANTAGPELRLITCAGDVDPDSGDYSDNVIVCARLLQT